MRSIVCGRKTTNVAYSPSNIKGKCTIVVLLLTTMVNYGVPLQMIMIRIRSGALVEVNGKGVCGPKTTHVAHLCSDITNKHTEHVFLLTIMEEIGVPQQIITIGMESGEIVNRHNVSSPSNIRAKNTMNVLVPLVTRGALQQVITTRIEDTKDVLTCDTWDMRTNGGGRSSTKKILSPISANDHQRDRGTRCSINRVGPMY